MDHSWFTAAEACAYLRLRSRAAFYQRVRRGQIPVHRLGRSLRFSRSSLDEVLLGKKNK